MEGEFSPTDLLVFIFSWGGGTQISFCSCQQQFQSVGLLASWYYFTSLSCWRSARKCSSLCDVAKWSHPLRVTWAWTCLFSLILNPALSPYCASRETFHITIAAAVRAAIWVPPVVFWLAAGAVFRSRTVTGLRLCSRRRAVPPERLRIGSLITERCEGGHMPWVWEETRTTDLSDLLAATCERSPCKCRQVVFSDEELANKRRCGQPR